ncbi:MAG: sugar phosphate isomerase/epimerase [Verrucomicrobiae bacterium]|nr:sugar phosphate isomerase/epimerase [Verrucomicrobiae bacterium]
MKISAPDWCFFKKGCDPIDYYRRLRDSGIAGVEMVPEERWDAARSAGLEIVNIPAPGMQKGLNSTVNHVEILPQIRKTIQQAAKAGIPQVIVFSGNRNGEPEDAGFKNCLEGLKTLLPLAESLAVTLIFEMLNSHDHAGYEGCDSHYGFELVRQLNSPNMKVLYDIYHLARMGEKIFPALTDNLSSVAHIHVAEIPRRTKPLADGNPGYREMVKKIQHAGYQGFLGLEFLPQTDPFDELKEVCRCFQSLAAG